MTIACPFCLSLLHPSDEGDSSPQYSDNGQTRIPDHWRDGFDSGLSITLTAQGRRTAHHMGATWEPSERTGALGFRVCRNKKMR